MKTVRITGGSGQGGAYLSRLLLQKGYRVVGTSRDARLANRSGLEFLGISADVEIVSMPFYDRRRIECMIDELRPDEIYHLSSPSSVARSFLEPGETTEDIVMSTVNILESIRHIGAGIRFFNAVSTEMFGDSPSPIDEESRLSPYSPYGVAKSAAFLQTRNYRDAYGVYACSGNFSNFESALRQANFVTSKIVSAASRIAAGEEMTLPLGNTGIYRDWGFAGDYVEAAWRMLQLDQPEDLVIATGKMHSLSDFIEIAFEMIGKDPHQYVTTDDSLLRPLDINRSVGNPARAEQQLGWRARHDLRETRRKRCDAHPQQRLNTATTSSSNVMSFPK